MLLSGGWLLSTKRKRLLTQEVFGAIESGRFLSFNENINQVILAINIILHQVHCVMLLSFVFLQSQVYIHYFRSQISENL